jgi:hypothetical protein
MHDDPSLRNLPPAADAIAARHEVADLPLAGIKGFIVFLGLMLCVTFIAVWLVFHVLLRVSVGGDATPSPFAGASHLPPAPQIQPSRDHNTLDQQDLQAFRDEENTKLTQYAWIGNDKQAARIPIEKAMDLLLAQGLPTRQGDPTGGPAALPIQGGAGGLMVAPSNPLTLPPGNVTPQSQEETNP